MPPISEVIRYLRGCYEADNRESSIFNLRSDPYERADVTSNTYYDWVMDHIFAIVPAQAYVARFLGTFKEYPQRQKAASFNLNEVLEKMSAGPVK